MNNNANASVFEPFENNRFHFACHEGVSCFTECCAKLRLLLTPYDILRMKNRLHMTSDEFLEKCTETVSEPAFRFPMVKLRMGEGSGKKCPFVTENGCTIYEDRPEACRLYPVGRASSMVENEDNAREKFFIVRESHCKGFNEEKQWSLEQWLNHEGVRQYKAMNSPWAGIVTSSRSLGAKTHIPKKHQMFFMASYNLDRFRNFLFNSRFFSRFEVDAAQKEKMKTDDVALMAFAFLWLRFSLFGEKTLQTQNM